MALHIKGFHSVFGTFAAAVAVVMVIAVAVVNDVTWSGLFGCKE